MSQNVIIVIQLA